MSTKQTSIINQIIMGIKSNDIALEHNLTPARISHVNNSIKWLETEPKIINGVVICNECESPENLMINKNKKTGGSSAIVCKECNRKLKLQYSLNIKKISQKFNQTELSILLTKGVTLFSLLKLTPEANEFLKINNDLMEVIEKW